MTRISFIVEGKSEVVMLESPQFKNWAARQGLEIGAIVDAKGSGNLCERLMPNRVEECLAMGSDSDYVVVLTDLDCDPCVTATKERMGCAGVDLVVVARQALEAWFLADTEAMRRWLGQPDFFEEQPEQIQGKPFQHLQELKTRYQVAGRIGRGHSDFANKFINEYGFSIERAAAHPACPSAQYFIKKITSLTVPSL